MGKFSSARAGGRRSGVMTGSIYQRGDRLCLDKIDFPVEKSALCKFARSCWPDASSVNRTEQGFKYGGTTVRVEFEQVLAGVRKRAREENDQSLIYQALVCGVELAKSRRSRRRQRADNGPQETAQIAARDPHNPDCATAGGRGNRGDSVGRTSHGGALAEERSYPAAFSIWRVMYHCWEIDSTLFTNQ